MTTTPDNTTNMTRSLVQEWDSSLFYPDHVDFLQCGHYRGDEEATITTENAAASSSSSSSSSSPPRFDIVECTICLSDVELYKMVPCRRCRQSICEHCNDHVHMCPFCRFPSLVYLDAVYTAFAQRFEALRILSRRSRAVEYFQQGLEAWMRDMLVFIHERYTMLLECEDVLLGFYRMCKVFYKSTRAWYLMQRTAEFEREQEWRHAMGPLIAALSSPVQNGNEENEEDGADDAPRTPTSGVSQVRNPLCLVSGNTTSTKYDCLLELLEDLREFVYAEGEEEDEEESDDVYYELDQELEEWMQNGCPVAPLARMDVDPPHP